MQLSVKLATALSAYRPDGAAANRFALSLSGGGSVADVIAQLGIPADRPLLVIVNDSLIPAAELASCQLADGDAVSLNQPIHAG